MTASLITVGLCASFIVYSLLSYLRTREKYRKKRDEYHSIIINDWASAVANDDKRTRLVCEAYALEEGLKLPKVDGEKC